LIAFCLSGPEPEAVKKSQKITVAAKAIPDTKIFFSLKQLRGLAISEPVERKPRGRHASPTVFVLRCSENSDPQPSWRAVLQRRPRYIHDNSQAVTDCVVTAV